MFNSPILDVAIGMIFVYLLLSLLATAAQEVIASQTRDRGKLLRQSISTLLYDDILGYTLSSRFYSHPIIKKFNIDREAPLPSYISDETFVKVLKDILPTSDAEGNLVIQSNASETVKERLELLPNSELKIMLLNFLGNRKDSETIDDHIKRFDQTLMDWFNATMDRATGFYKRKTQKHLIIMGFLFAAFVNADSIHVYNVLSRDKAARDKIVQQAIQYVNDHPDSASLAVSTPADTALRNDITGQFRALMRDSNYMRVDETLGMGWTYELKRMWLPNFDYTTSGLVGKIWWVIAAFFMNLVHLTWLVPKLLGWLLTALAISLGAPFWFDLLKKVINIRGAGGKPDVVDDGVKKKSK